jgi:16S rRNA (uracil1498-N3)-methyltransferase
MQRLGEIRTNKRAAIDSGLSIQGRAFDAFLLWRLRPGEAVTITDKDNVLWRARVIRTSKDSAELRVFERRGTNPDVDVTLIQALPEKERMELIIQKAGELGATRIAPIKTARSISIEERESGQRKAHKWQEVALKASRQCRSSFITEVMPYRQFMDALGLCRGSGLNIMLVEKGDAVPIKDALSSPGRGRGICVLTGPEGGFEDHEINAAVQRGFTPVSLGQRILRTETASIAAMAVISCELSL